VRQKKINYNSYYSKTLYLSGPNDAFYLWNRWMIEDETGMQCLPLESKMDDMSRFFANYEDAFELPVLSKNNCLSTYAKTVADALETSYFICMTRDPAYLAQSLLEARLEIQGDIHVSYGVDNPERLNHDGNYEDDFVTGACDQVLYHERHIHEQQRLIGADRYWIVRYEDFCADPAALVHQVYEKILKQPKDIEEIRSTLKPFSISNKIRLGAELFQQIQQTIDRLQHADTALAEDRTPNHE